MVQFFQVVEVVLRDYQCRVVRAIGSTKTGTQQSAVTSQVIQMCSTRNRDGTISLTTILCFRTLSAKTLRRAMHAAFKLNSSFELTVTLSEQRNSRWLRNATLQDHDAWELACAHDGAWVCCTRDSRCPRPTCSL